MGSLRTLRIGTRSSVLALCQVDIVVSQLRNKGIFNPIEIIKIQTSGDRIQDRPLAEVGGKALFAKEIQYALLSHQIDLGVHSLKDMETISPTGLCLTAFLKREEVMDVLVTQNNHTLESLPFGAIVGTCSPRRTAQILHFRPDLSIASLRGNIITRLKKLEEGSLSGIILALAGLKRLELTHKISQIFSPQVMIPAVGQGALTVECRTDDDEIKAICQTIDDTQTRAAITAERHMLHLLGGNCHTPIGGYASFINENTLQLTGLLASLDGKVMFTSTHQGHDPENVGRLVAQELLTKGAYLLTCS